MENQETIAVFANLPVPPSHNQCYRNVPRIGRVASAKLIAFRKEMQKWLYQHHSEVKLAVDKCGDALDAGFLFQVNCYFLFNRKSLYTLEGQPKKMDVSNRIKALHDSIADIIQIDDRLFWSVYCEKVELKLNEPESSTCVIKSYKPMVHTGTFR